MGDFQICDNRGADNAFVKIVLNPGETVYGEPGSLFYMGKGVEPHTSLADGETADKGVFSRVSSAVMRRLSGERFFLTAFTNKDKQPQEISFSGPFPGKVHPIHLREWGEHVVCQKGAYLCSLGNVSIGVAFQIKVGFGVFGRQGFMLQKVSGLGIAFVHSGGILIEKDLQDGEEVRVDIGCLVAFQGKAIEYDVEPIKDLGSILFGKEGIVLLRLKGPGKILLSSMPFSRMVSRIAWEMPPERKEKA